jgi:methionyl-tRNA formyltransferase
MTRKLRLVFMGTPDFALPVFKALLSSPHQVVAVYTQPPRPAGRGYELKKSPVHELADQHHIPVFTPVNFKNEQDLSQFKDLQPDVAIVAAYGLLLPQSILETPRFGCINVHVSLLPRWRGASPVQQAILAGDEESGVTIIQMEKAMDAGPILRQKAIPLPQDATAQALYHLLFEMGGEMISDVLDRTLKGTLLPTLQSETGLSYAPKITKKDAFLDWSKPAIYLERQVRAFNSWPGAVFTWNREQIKVWKAKVVPGFTNKVPGTLLNDDFVIACGQDALQILILQLPGKKPMDIDAFKNGHQIPTGYVLDPCPVIS